PHPLNLLLLLPLLFLLGFSYFNQSINFIYKAQYHKSQFASQGFTAYNIPLSFGPSQRIRKNSPKNPFNGGKKKL
ncbi:hypothetical protein, partial [Salmonella sp. gx-f7]|uniref:hypothetical protein n=1 Tax=Salmonella sp. gx-f7 TaxID=2582606 RepID=UPI001F32835C